MSSGDYSQLLKAVPGIDSLIAGAPQAGGLAGKASSLLGGSAGSMKGMTALADSFSKLGLSPDMVKPVRAGHFGFCAVRGGATGHDTSKKCIDLRLAFTGLHKRCRCRGRT